MGRERPVAQVQGDGSWPLVARATARWSRCRRNCLSRSAASSPRASNGNHAARVGRLVGERQVSSNQALVGSSLSADRHTSWSTPTDCSASRSRPGFTAHPMPTTVTPAAVSFPKFLIRSVQAPWPGSITRMSLSCKAKACARTSDRGLFRTVATRSQMTPPAAMSDAIAPIADQSTWGIVRGVRRSSRPAAAGSRC